VGTRSTSAAWRELRHGLDRAGRWLPAVVLVLGITTAGLIAWELNTRADQRAAAEFQLETERVTTLLSLQTGRMEQLLRGTAAFIATEPEVTAGAFHNYIESLDLAGRFPGVRAVVYAPLVRASNEALVRERLAGDLTRRELAYPPFDIWPESDRKTAFPAVLVEPQRGNDRVFGYDLWTQPDRREAAWRAIATGRLQASAPVVLSQDQGAARVSQLLVMPILRPASLAEVGPDSVPRFIGFVASGVSVDDLVAATPAVNLFRRTGLTVHDAGPVAAGGAARASFGAAEGGQAGSEPVALFAPADAARAEAEHTREITFAGRRWLLGFSGVDAFRTPVQDALTYGTALGGAAMSLLLALLLQRLTSERRRLRAQVAARATELRGVNAELRHRLEEVREANHAKSQFLASVSHELRTPLNAILGFSEMLQSEIFGPVGSAKNREYVNDIHAAGGRLLTQVNQLLDLSRIEAGGRELQAQPVDVADALERCRQLVTHMRHGAGPAAQHAHVLIEAAAGLPWLHADPDALDQILLNLASNAVKFSPAGAPVRLRADLAEDGGLRVTVVDEGPGIPLFHHGKITEPFYQVADQHSRATEGSGLGLAIVDRLARAHGARLAINSAPGQGTAIGVHFPPARSLVSTQQTARLLAG
jgi:signal transduction histidine kinase